MPDGRVNACLAHLHVCLVAYLALMLAMTSAAVSAESHEPGGTLDQPRAFHIPAQPLAAALSEFSAVTRLQLLVDAALTEKLRSIAISGHFTPRVALQAMLAGSGLTIRPLGEDGFTLVAAPQPSRNSGTDKLAGVAPVIQRFAVYSGGLQAALRQALCRYDETRPGQYRALIRLWIGANGAVTRSEFVSAVADPRRHRAVQAALEEMAFDPPPADLPQPVTLLLTPTANAADYCGGYAQGQQVLP
jgi:hypothetical protein